VETNGSVDYGSAERIVSLISVSQTHMPSPISPKTPKRSWQLMDERENKNYPEACLEQLRHFTPFVIFTDDLLGKEAKILLKKLSALLA
jgi:hypothetical protein